MISTNVISLLNIIKLISFANSEIKENVWIKLEYFIYKKKKKIYLFIYFVKFSAMFKCFFATWSFATRENILFIL